jgi:hypothetical protein
MHAQRARATQPTTGIEQRRYRLLLAGLILLALALRLARLTFQPLWWDEGWSLYFATTDLGTMLQRTAVDIHPPFYYLLLHLWTRLFGPGIVPVRLFSVLIGTAAVPLMAAVGRRLLGASGGLLAAFLLAISPFHVYYAQEVRMYGLVMLLGLAATYFALRWPWGASAWSGYVLVATAALYTQYYAGFLLLGLNLVVLIRWLRRSAGRHPLRNLLSWLAAQVAVALLFLPWAWYASDKLVTYVRFKVSVEQDPSMGFFTYLGRHLAAFTWGHTEGVLAGWWWLGLLPPVFLALALAARGLRSGPGQRGPDPWPWEPMLWPLALVAIPLLCGFAVNLGLPFNPPRSERLLLLALPAYLLMAAGGFLALVRRRRELALPAVPFLLAAVLSLVAFYIVPRYPQDDYRPVAARVGSLALPTDVVVCVHPWQVGYFYAYLPDDTRRPALVLTPRQVLPRERQLWADDPALMADDLEALLAQHNRLWFPAHQAMGRILEDQIALYLSAHSYPTLDEWYGENTVLSLYATGQPGPVSAAGRFGQWLVLEGAALEAGALEAGWGVVAVDLAWQVLASPGEAHHLGLRLVGPTGHVWAQRDTPPGGGLASFDQWPRDETLLDRHGMLVPAGTPPGDYDLTLRVYRSRDVEVLPATFQGGSGGEVTLGTVCIVRPAVPPPPEALDVARPFRVDFGPLRLLGANTRDPGPLLPGEAVGVELFWQARDAPGQDYLPRLQLLDGQGLPVAELQEKPVAGTYPTAWWQAGELVRDPHALPLPAAVPAGRYGLALTLVRAADGQVLDRIVELDQIEVTGREHRFEPPAPHYSQAVPFGPAIELSGYDLDGAGLAPGRSLQVILYWHALDTPDRNYHTFVHLLDGDGNIVAQHDGPPGNGRLPSLGWLPGEYLADPHSLYLPPDLPVGAYRLEVGLYEPVTWQRPAEGAILDTPILVSRDG